MQRLLIIDNEPIIREGLKSVIPWDEYGYHVCGTAVDGRDGLNKIRVYQPDLLLLDIRMPGLSGIDLVHQLRKENIDCNIIVLSAYSSFSYAKELMGLGIDFYLLKPIDENELVEILEKIELERRKEKQIQDQLILLNQMNEENSLRLLLEGKIEEVSQDTLSIYKNKNFQVARFSSELKRVNDQWLRDQVSNDSEQIKLIRKDNHYHLLFIDKRESFVKQFLLTIMDRFSLYGDNDVVMMLGDLVDGPEKIIHSYTQTKELIDIHFCFSEEKVLSYDHLDKNNSEDIQELEEIDKQKLFHYIEFGDHQNINKKGEKLEQYYQFVRYPKERVQAELIEWSLSVIKLIKSNYPSIEIINENTFAQNINNQQNLQEIIKYLCKEMRKISISINKVYPSKGNIVDKVIDYVNHYYHEDINLKFVADLFHYNNAYLGKVFKKQTGKYFNEYLHEVRINNAKKLLTHKNYKVYEISKLVGYSNSDYFYKNFKEHEGMSPKEYQMKNRTKH